MPAVNALRPYSSTTYRHNYGCALQRCLLLLEPAVLHTNPMEGQESDTVWRHPTAREEDLATAKSISLLKTP
ncbi:MAG: hypothetical protein GY805_16830 [Chloroflexi bacterium]|nr:hypothetical protein [Chloroflexota bacterium]